MSTLSDETMVKIEQDLHDEIEQIKRTLRTIDARLDPLQDEHDEAQRLADKTGKVKDQEHANRLHESLMRTINNSTELSAKLGVLRDPGELERRINAKLHTMERIGKLTEATKEQKAAKVTAKDQGFPAAYLGENGNFRPGLDARAKSDLINCVLGLESADSLFKGTAAEATKLIEVRGWTSQLARKRELVEEKTARKAEKQAEKEKAAQERATAKTAKSAAKAPADGNDVSPDPKPTSTKKTGRKVGA